jgi:hypothetical protein
MQAYSFGKYRQATLSGSSLISWASAAGGCGKWVLFSIAKNTMNIGKQTLIAGIFVPGQNISVHIQKFKK